MHPDFFLHKRIEKERDHYNLTLSIMRDETYAIKYVIMHLDHSYGIRKMMFTSTEGRVTWSKGNGIIRIERWEEENGHNVRGGQPHKDFPLPLLILSNEPEDQSFASRVIQNSLECVEEPRIIERIYHLIEAPETDEYINVMEINNLQFV